MAEEQAEQEEKKKGPLLKIILFAVGGILILVLTILATLFFSGAFEDEVTEEVEQTLEQLEKDAAAGEKSQPKESKAENPEIEVESVEDCAEDDLECIEANSGPKKVARETPEAVGGYVQSYQELSRPLIANLSNSRKVMQITLAVMTQYDEKVLENVEKHEFALRSVILDIMRQVTDDDITRPDFRVELAERIRLGMNSVLERWENFGGIEEVYFTEFVIQ